ncbi:ALB4, partial [Symbiodinium sp. CCMP2456]
SSAIMQLIRPKVEQIQRKYKSDQETQNRMLLRLYDDCGVNPLGGCIPSVVQIPIFIGLYRSILKLAEINPKFKEPFLWIPSLAGPVTGSPSLDRAWGFDASRVQGCLSRVQCLGSMYKSEFRALGNQCLGCGADLDAMVLLQSLGYDWRL